MVSVTDSQAADRHRELVDSIHTSAVAGGVVTAVAAWSGLVWLIFLSNQLPTLPNRWIFYALLQIALTGSSLPFVRFLHQRFGRRGGLLISPVVLVRQSMWVGLFGTACAWLAIPRLLSLPVALIIAGALLVIETLLRLRERAQWRPE